MRTPHTLEYFLFPVPKDMLRVALAENFCQECMKNCLSCLIGGEKISARGKSCVNYRLGLSMSSIAARSFCLAFLLICDPRQTFTRLVSCFVEYSCPKKENPSLTSNVLTLIHLINTTEEQADIWCWWVVLSTVSQGKQGT